MWRGSNWSCLKALSENAGRSRMDLLWLYGLYHWRLWTKWSAVLSSSVLRPLWLSLHFHVLCLWRQEPPPLLNWHQHPDLNHHHDTVYNCVFRGCYDHLISHYNKSYSVYNNQTIIRGFVPTTSKVTAPRRWGNTSFSVSQKLSWTNKEVSISLFVGSLCLRTLSCQGRKPGIVSCGAGLDLSSHMRESFFQTGLWKRGRGAHHLDGMQKCRSREGRRTHGQRVRCGSDGRAEQWRWTEEQLQHLHHEIKQKN